MKYKIIASVLVVLILLAVLALKGCNQQQPVDADGNPVATEQVQ